MTNSEKAFENWLFAQPFFDAESYAIDSSIYATEKEAWNAAIELAKDICVTYVEICDCDYRENKLTCAAARHLCYAARDIEQQIEGVKAK